MFSVCFISTLSAVVGANETKAEPVKKSVQSVPMIGSVYHQKYHGRKTADGSVFDIANPYMVAATYIARGMKIHITAVPTGRRLETCVRDLLPPPSEKNPRTNGATIDLSEGARDALGLDPAPGLYKLRVQIVGTCTKYEGIGTPGVPTS